MTLNELTQHDWSVVARRVRLRETNTWEPVLSKSEFDVLIMAREQGGILTAQRRGVNGKFELVAKLRRVA